MICENDMSECEVGADNIQMNRASTGFNENAKLVI